MFGRSGDVIPVLFDAADFILHAATFGPHDKLANVVLYIVLCWFFSQTPPLSYLHGGTGTGMCAAPKRFTVVRNHCPSAPTLRTDLYPVNGFHTSVKRITNSGTIRNNDIFQLKATVTGKS
jgi:hypothetical protein